VQQGYGAALSQIVVIGLEIAGLNTVGNFRFLFSHFFLLVLKNSHKNQKIFLNMVLLWDPNGRSVKKNLDNFNQVSNFTISVKNMLFFEICQKR
jgi:hypothetical protein